jgi:hypothetical protein
VRIGRVGQHGGCRATTSIRRFSVTLIVPFISEEFVALASDRRITWEIGGASTRWEDTEN